MKKRIWGLFEALGFCLTYYVAATIAQFLLLCVFSVYYAVLMSIDHSVFDAAKFFTDVTDTVNSMPMLMVLVKNLVVVALFSIIIRVRGGKFKKYVSLENASVRSVVFSAISGAGFWLLTQIVINKFLAETAFYNEYTKHIGGLLGDNIMITLAVSIVVAPLVEEIVFRGALYRALQRMGNEWIAVLLTSVLFALAHVNPLHMSYALVLGILLALLRMKTKSIVPCIAMHIVYNAMNYIPMNFSLELWFVLIVTLVSYTLALHKKI